MQPFADVNDDNVRQACLTQAPRKGWLNQNCFCARKSEMPRGALLIKSILSVSANSEFCYQPSGQNLPVLDQAQTVTVSGLLVEPLRIVSTWISSPKIWNNHRWAFYTAAIILWDRDSKHKFFHYFCFRLCLVDQYFTNEDIGSLTMFFNPANEHSWARLMVRHGKQTSWWWIVIIIWNGCNRIMVVTLFGDWIYSYQLIMMIIITK